MDNTGDTGTMELPPGLTPGHLGQVQDAKFDIVLYLQDFKNGIDIVCNYFTGLFLPETIEKVMTKYIRLLEKIALDPGKPVTEYKTETKKRLLRGNQ
jgi:hypothetical protein